VTVYQDYRAIPLEVLRDFAQTQSELTSIRAASRESGISHSAFQQFIVAKTTPHARIRRILALWYLAKQSEADDIDIIRPYVAALSVLLADIPEPEQDAARGEAVALLQCVYEGRTRVPRWLELMLKVSGPSR
jgi:hypothetical protein